MSTETVNWNIEVSKETDRGVRRLLGGKRRGARDIARFVEEAVETRLFDEMLAATRARNADLSAEEAQALVDEAMDAAHEAMWGQKAVRTG